MLYKYIYKYKHVCCVQTSMTLFYHTYLYNSNELCCRGICCIECLLYNILTYGCYQMYVQLNGDP